MLQRMTNQPYFWDKVQAQGVVNIHIIPSKGSRAVHSKRASGGACLPTFVYYPNSLFNNNNNNSNNNKLTKGFPEIGRSVAYFNPECVQQLKTCVTY